MKAYRTRLSSLSVRLMALLLLVVIAGSGLTLFSVTRITRRQFLSYVQESDRLRARELATGLASYYADQGSFRDVEELLQPALRPRDSDTMVRRMREMHRSSTPGMMMPPVMPERVILVDEDTRIIADTHPSRLAAGEDAYLSDARTRGEPVADVIVRAGDLRGVEVRGDQVPRMIDEFPILAVAASQAQGETVVRDAAELRVKETDRIANIAAELRKLGARIEEMPDGFVVEGPTPLVGTQVHSHGDHRLAMSLAIAGLVAEGETTIAGAKCIADSFPGFEETLRVLMH